ncbi:hypothetical protein ACA910_018910 [Epithemia clementina (nom. ined.)]
MRRRRRHLLSTRAADDDNNDNNTVDSLLLALQPPRKGTGFDNFTPKHGGSDNNTTHKEKDTTTTTKPNHERKESETKKEEDTLAGAFRTSGGSGGGRNSGDSNNNNSNNNNRWENWVPAIVLLLITYAVMGRDHDDDPRSRSTSENGGAALMEREISWHDFLQLLQQQDVVKIVVSEERDRARIYLRSNAVGFSGGSGSGTMSPMMTNPSAASSYEERRRRRQQQQQQQQQSSREYSSSSSSSPSPSPTSDNNNNNSPYSFDHEDESDQVQGFSSSSSGRSGSSERGSAAILAQTPFFYRMQIGNVDSFERKLEEAQRALQRHPDQDVPVQYLPTSNVTREVLRVLPGIFLAAVTYAGFYYAARSFGATGSGGGRGGMGGLFQIGKSTARKINKEDVGVTFADVAGCDQAKAEIMEFVDFLKDSERFTKLGAKIPKGALLCGPPGTGKTLLAKAVAGEAGVPFFSISGSDFIEMFVGVGPSRVRDLFNEARQSAPCIIFIDEIDAVGRQRGRGGMGGNDERENTLNQLLVEMDGFETSTGVVVLAGTNRVDILDQALTRPGRFDRQITVDKPDLAGRKEIFKVHLRGITLDGEVESMAGRLSGLTPGFAGADIANICNEAAIVAARRNADTVSMDDFEKAIDRVIGGLESNKIMSSEERSIVAHHEAGHAVAGWFLEHADPLMKVTIIPRTSGALGYAQYLPKEVFLRTHAQIMDIVCMALAGRASEQIFFGRVTTGAQDDLKRVTDIVYSTIQLYGMNPRLGQLSFPKDPNAFWDERPYSEKTAKAMDEEARAIVDGAYERTLNLLKEKKEQVEAVAKLLLDKETITHDDLVELIGERPFEGDPAYREYVKRKWKTIKEDTGDSDKTEEKSNEDKEEGNSGEKQKGATLGPEPSM